MRDEAEWKFGRRGAGCAGCAAEFRPGATVNSALYAADPATGHSFDRRDWCSACFGDAARRGEPFSWWASVVPEPETKRAALDIGIAREFLVRLLREDAPERAPLRYLLVLLLLRKKVVEVTEQFTDARGDVMVVRVPPEETTWEVLCADIGEEEAASLREELGRLFSL